MSSPVDVLSKGTGLTKKDIQDIWNKMKANLQLLDSCTCHDFSIEKDKWWVCSNCGGFVTKQSKSWYEKGFEHGSQNRKSD